ALFFFVLLTLGGERTSDSFPALSPAIGGAAANPLCTSAPGLPGELRTAARIGAGKTTTVISSLARCPIASGTACRERSAPRFLATRASRSGSEMLRPDIGAVTQGGSCIRLQATRAVTKSVTH